MWCHQQSVLESGSDRSLSAKSKQHNIEVSEHLFWIYRDVSLYTCSIDIEVDTVSLWICSIKNIFFHGTYPNLEPVFHILQTVRLQSSCGCWGLKWMGWRPLVALYLAPLCQNVIDPVISRKRRYNKFNHFGIWVVVSNIFHFQPYLGEDSQFD